MPNPDDTEPSAPFPAAPAATGAPSSAATLTVNARTLSLAALLFLGGAGGGGIGSNLIGGGVEKEVAGLTEGVKSLEHSVEIVANSVIEMKAELKADRRGQVKIEEALKDHEERIRDLEQRRR